MIYIRLLSFSVFESERERFVHDIRLRRLSVCKSVRPMRARALARMFIILSRSHSAYYKFLYFVSFASLTTLR